MGGRIAWQTAFATSRQVKMASTPVQFELGQLMLERERRATGLTDDQLGEHSCCPDAFAERRVHRRPDGRLQEVDRVPISPHEDAKHDREERHGVLEARAVLGGRWVHKDEEQSCGDHRQGHKKGGRLRVGFDLIREKMVGEPDDEAEDGADRNVEH